MGRLGPYYNRPKFPKKTPEELEKIREFEEKYPKTAEHRKIRERPHPASLIWPRPLNGLTKFPNRPNLRKECGYPDPAEAVNCCCGIKPYPCCPAMRIPVCGCYGGCWC